MTAPAFPESPLERFIRSNEVLKPGLPTVEDACRTGRDYHVNGPVVPAV